MARPLVSVVMPTYDRIGLLPMAIASVREQTLESWELIVVDDGSADGTGERVSRLDEPRLRYIGREHTGNIAAVRNAGVLAARGEWIAFLDSDDRWRPDKLARQFARLGSVPESRWCYGEYQLVDRSGRPVAKAAGGPWQPFEGWILERILTTEAGATIPTLLVRAELANELPFDPGIPLAEDYDFVLRLAARAPACAVAGILADVLVHDGRTTAISGRYAGHLGKAIAYGKAANALDDQGLRRIARRQLRAHVQTLTRLAVRHGAVGELVRAAHSLWRL